MTNRQLAAYEAKRDIGAELLQAAREVNAAKAARIHRMPLDGRTITIFSGDPDAIDGNPEWTASDFARAKRACEVLPKLSLPMRRKRISNHVDDPAIA